MADPADRQLKIADQRFTCIRCGHCCRRWHVELSAADLARIRAQEWGEDGPPQPLTITLGGRQYLAHRADDSCIFLDPETRLCELHRRFGEAAKPLGCRLYPLAPAATFAGEASVLGRFDCPAIRQDQGEPLRRDRAAIRRLVAEAEPHGAFDREDLEGLEPERARQLLAALRQHTLDHPGVAADARPVLLVMAVDRLQTLGSDFLNAMDLGEILPSFFARLADDLTRRRPRQLSRIEQWRFLSVFTAYLRRDEELVGKGPVARLKRLAAVWRMLLSRGSLSGLGAEHPRAEVRRRDLFRQPVANAAELDWELPLRMLRLRLETWQFMGRAMNRHDYYTGLKTTAFAFPMIVAAAKWAALARDPEDCRIQPEDIDYASGAIDHSLGRGELTRQGIFTTFTRQMTEPENYANLLRTLLAGKP